MSSLQKFHRRTQSSGTPPITWPPTLIGEGDNTLGFWLGDISSNKLIVAPKSTEVQRAWGSNGTVRGTTSTTDGLTNTNTLYSFGSEAHPAAYYCKTLTLGGYNTWYLPAKDELNTLYSNKSATPFATANSFLGSNYWQSTEYAGNYAWLINFSSGNRDPYNSKAYTTNVRAVRRTAI